jgi:antitoxin HigA-1
MSTSNNITDREEELALPVSRGDWCPTHPGALLAEDVIPATGRSKTEIAKLLGISRQHLHDILAERKPVSAEVAVRLGKLLGNGPRLWIGMQAAYDTWQAEHDIDVSAIPTIQAAE